MFEKIVDFVFNNLITSATLLALVIIVILTIINTANERYKSLRDGLVAALIIEIVVVVISIKNETLAIRKTYESKINVESEVKNLMGKVDPDLRSMLPNYLDLEEQKLTRAILEKEIVITDPAMFLYTYKKTFELFPKSTFIGTSLPYKNYFWSAPFL